MVEIVLVSGNARGSAEIKQRTLRGVASAVRKGETKTRKELLPTVAKKTGAFRQGVNKALDSETIKIVASKNKIKISLRKGKVTTPTYAKYHIHPGSKFGQRYKKPTTPGTKPLDVRVWNRRLAKNIRAEVPRELIKQGVGIRG